MGPSQENKPHLDSSCKLSLVKFEVILVLVDKVAAGPLVLQVARRIDLAHDWQLVLQLLQYI